MDSMLANEIKNSISSLLSAETARQVAASEVLDALEKSIDRKIEMATDKIISSLKGPKLVKGVKEGIAKPLGISTTLAYKLFRTGVFDDAISGHRKCESGNHQIMLIDVTKVQDIAMRTNLTSYINNFKDN